MKWRSAWKNEIIQFPGNIQFNLGILNGTRLDSSVVFYDPMKYESLFSSSFWFLMLFEIVVHRSAQANLGNLQLSDSL